MTKNQKIWMWIFLAMFLIPEILWSPILTLILPILFGSYYKFRNSFLFSGDVGHGLVTVIVFIQFLGILLLNILIFKNKNNSSYKLFLSIFLFLVSMLALLALCLQLAIGGSSIII